MDPSGDIQRERGLEYARNLNFTDNQYDEAIKVVNSPNDLNELLMALIDVSKQQGDISKQPGQSNRHILGRSKSIETTQNDAKQDVAQLNLIDFPTIYAKQNVPTISRSSISSSTSITDSSTTLESASSLISFTSTKPLIVSESSQDRNAVKNDPNRNVQLLSRTSLSNIGVESMRKIYIDGSNVARAHGKDVVYSWLGIQICVQWFFDRGHSIIKVFVPEIKYQQALSLQAETQNKLNKYNDSSVLDYLQRNDALVKTPTGSNDDMFLIEAARLNNGVIVSNDLFREEQRQNEEWQRYVNHNRLPYVFVDDLFIPANDPLGRYGPTLNQFLRVKDNNQQEIDSAHHDKLWRTQSHQRFERRSVVGVNKHQVCNSWASQRRSLQITHSLPLRTPNNESVIDSSTKRSGNESLESSMSSINLYDLQRSTRDDSSRTAPSGRTKIYRTSTSIQTIDNEKPKNVSNRSGPTITHRNALYRTKSHN